jgi:hypothetical protein
LSVSIAGGDGGWPWAGGFGRPQMLPSSAGSGRQGGSVTSGSTTNGRCSQSMSICSIASVAVSSSTAAIARIGSPW